MVKIFDGKIFSAQKLKRLHDQVAEFVARENRAPTILSIFPYEDDASVLYTKLKRKDAATIGITYATQPLSLKDPAETWMKAIQKANKNSKIDGILVQKPARGQYLEITGQSKEQYFSWWSAISESIMLEKDVDGLNPYTLLELAAQADRVMRQKIAPYANLSQFTLPATAQAVIDITMDVFKNDLVTLRQQRIVILGTSVIVGRPAMYGFRMLGIETDIYGSDADISKVLKDADVIVSATGRANLIDSAWIKEGSILLDVGAPHAEFQSGCYDICSVYTPVPGGVGPVTRACLLENVLK